MISLSIRSCTGYESNLTQCEYSIWYSSTRQTCHYYYGNGPAGVNCSGVANVQIYLLLLHTNPFYVYNYAHHIQLGEPAKYFLLNAAEISKEAEGSIRVLGGSGSHEGLVEMYLLGQWTTFCNRYVYTWNMSVAEVVCQQLGYSGAVAAPRGYNFNVETQRRPYGVSNFQCSGYEVNITNCEKQFSDGCSRNIAGVICSPAC